MNNGVAEKCRKWLKQGMCGMLPKYGEDGSNGTLIILAGRSPARDRRRVQTVVAELAALYQKDIVLIRRQAREITGQRTMNPLPICPQIILVPFKVRKPIGKDDGAVGYVFENAIANVKPADKGAILILKDGQKVEVMDSLATVKRHIKNAQHVRKYTMEQVMARQNMEVAWMEMKREYNRPATRGDIALLSKNIMALMEKLGIGT